MMMYLNDYPLNMNNYNSYFENLKLLKHIKTDETKIKK